MRDLTKYKRELLVRNAEGRPLMGIFRSQGKRGKRVTSLAFYLEIPGYPNQFIPRDFKDMRMTQLTQAARYIGETLEKGAIGQEAAEKVLDLIYTELARRIDKRKT